MKVRCHNPGWARAAVALALLTGRLACGQTPPKTEIQTQAASLPAAPAPAHSSSDGVLADQVIAVVNGDLLLESDVDQERRAEAFQPVIRIGEQNQNTRADIVNRLIDRMLILQQSKLQPDDQVTLEQARAQLQKIASEIPACKQYHCDTPEGWKKFVEAHGFTVPQIEERERQQMEILKYIELRFRAGIHITQQQIKDYYDHTLVPGELKLKAKPPSLDAVSDQIQVILLEQQVNNLLEDWLTSLKAQGTVTLMKPAEEVP